MKTLALCTALFVAACTAVPTPIDESSAPAKAGSKTKNGGGGFGDSEPIPGESADGACAGTIAQAPRGEVDIIFVIDNSGSMTEEMTQIRTNVNRFAQSIGALGVDYRVVFLVRKGVNSGNNEICVPEPLAGPGCSDRAGAFFHVDQSVSSNNSLSLILSTYETSWRQHLRLEAKKVFVEVTDDESTMTSAAFDSALLAKAPAGMFGTAAKRNYVFHSIVSKPSGAAAPTTAKCLTADGTSVQYQNLSLLTGGIIDEVCKTDYSSVLDNIAKGIVASVGCELSYPKAEGTNPDEVVVRLTDGGATRDLVQVTDATKCDSVKDGWYYDDAAQPTKMILCAATCTAANAAIDAKLEARVGCKAPAPR